VHIKSKRRRGDTCPIAYVHNPKARHRKMTWDQEFIALLKKHRVRYDPRYVLGQLCRASGARVLVRHVPTVLPWATLLARRWRFEQRRSFCHSSPAAAGHELGILGQHTMLECRSLRFPGGFTFL